MKKIVVKKKIILSVIITIMVAVAVFISGVIIAKLNHIGDLAHCTITSPTQEQVQVIENELDINLSDNCTVTELSFMWSREIWGWNNTWLTIQIETTDPDVFFTNNISFETIGRQTIYDSSLNQHINYHTGLNRYDKEITFKVYDDSKTIYISEKMVRNFSECKEIFFGESAEVYWSTPIT